MISEGTLTFNDLPMTLDKIRNVIDTLLRKKNNIQWRQNSSGTDSLPIAFVNEEGIERSEKKFFVEIIMKKR